MASNVRVQNLESIQRFRMNLLIFIEKAKSAVDEARNEAQRTGWWLRYDRLPHWQREYRKREAKVQQARGDLQAAKMANSSETQFVQRQALIKAQLALEEAEEKLRQLKVWIRRFEGDVRVISGQCQRLGNALDMDLPKATVILGNLIARLEQYMEDSVPLSALAPAAEEKPEREPEETAEPKEADDAS